MTSGDVDTLGWSCSACRSDAAGDRLRWLRNCETDANANVAWTWAPELRRCPWSQIGGLAWFVVSTWSDWRTSKETPWGTLLDAPIWAAEGVLLCERIMSAHERAASQAVEG
jgi:hypothetical protein